MSFLEKNRRQFNRWARVYDSFVFRIYFEPLYKRLLSIIEQEAGEFLRKGGKFLDVACGTGEIISRLAKRYPKSEFVGFDLSPKMIEKAKEKIHEEENVSFQVGNVDALPFKDAIFDIVLCSEAFHHFEHPEQALKEIWRVLKKEEKFILEPPQFASANQGGVIAKQPSAQSASKKNLRIPSLFRRGWFILMDPAYDSLLQKLLVTIAGIFETSNRVYSRQEFLEVLVSKGFQVNQNFSWRFNNFFTSMKL